MAYLQSYDTDDENEMADGASGGEHRVTYDADCDDNNYDMCDVVVVLVEYERNLAKHCGHLPEELETYNLHEWLSDFLDRKSFSMYDEPSDHFCDFYASKECIRNRLRYGRKWEIEEGLKEYEDLLRRYDGYVPTLFLPSLLGWGCLIPEDAEDISAMAKAVRDRLGYGDRDHSYGRDEYPHVPDLESDGETVVCRPFVPTDVPHEILVKWAKDLQAHRSEHEAACATLDARDTAAREASREAFGFVRKAVREVADALDTNHDSLTKLLNTDEESIEKTFKSHGFFDTCKLIRMVANKAFDEYEARRAQHAP